MFLFVGETVEEAGDVTQVATLGTSGSGGETQVATLGSSGSGGETQVATLG